MEKAHLAKRAVAATHRPSSHGPDLAAALARACACWRPKCGGAFRRGRRKEVSSCALASRDSRAAWTCGLIGSEQLTGDKRSWGPLGSLGCIFTVGFGHGSLRLRRPETGELPSPLCKYSTQRALKGDTSRMPLVLRHSVRPFCLLTSALFSAGSEESMTSGHQIKQVWLLASCLPGHTNLPATLPRH